MLSYEMKWNEGLSLSVDSAAVLGKPATEFFYRPENARDVPCDDCPTAYRLTIHAHQKNIRKMKKST